MAGSRFVLHTKLVALLGSNNVYFQPPPTVKMNYPCIIYKRDGRNENFANDRLYLNLKRYSVTVVDANPDSLIPDKMLELRYCSFTTHYAVGGLNHDVYALYF